MRVIGRLAASAYFCCAIVIAANDFGEETNAVVDEAAELAKENEIAMRELSDRMSKEQTLAAQYDQGLVNHEDMKRILADVLPTAESYCSLLKYRQCFRDRECQWGRRSGAKRRSCMAKPPVVCSNLDTKRACWFKRKSGCVYKRVLSDKFLCVSTPMTEEEQEMIEDMKSNTKAPTTFSCETLSAKKCKWRKYRKQCMVINRKCAVRTTKSPTSFPTRRPEPTNKPTNEPTLDPTPEPTTKHPTKKPTPVPTAAPTKFVQVFDVEPNRDVKMVVGQIWKSDSICKKITNECNGKSGDCWNKVKATKVVCPKPMPPPGTEEREGANLEEGDLYQGDIDLSFAAAVARRE